MRVLDPDVGRLNVRFRIGFCSGNNSGFGSQSAGGFGASSVFGGASGGAGLGGGAQSGRSGRAPGNLESNMPGVIVREHLVVTFSCMVSLLGNPGRAPKWLSVQAVLHLGL